MKVRKLDLELHKVRLTSSQYRPVSKKLLNYHAPEKYQFPGCLVDCSAQHPTSLPWEISKLLNFNDLLLQSTFFIQCNSYNSYTYNSWTATILHSPLLSLDFTNTFNLPTPLPLPITTTTTKWSFKERQKSPNMAQSDIWIKLIAMEWLKSGE